VCALTFPRRFLYNISELPRDGASQNRRTVRVTDPVVCNRAFVGRIVRLVMGCFNLIHLVRSLELAEEIE